MTDEITLDAPETRLERFLAAAAGMDGITLDTPVTRIEKYLYKIAQGSGGVPTVEDADKGKYLHANESTGDLEWATAGGSGGGVLVVHATITETSMVLDKTYKEIADAASHMVVLLMLEDETRMSIGVLDRYGQRNGKYAVHFTPSNSAGFIADTVNDYPALQE